jgi:hypothetical protein
LLSNVVRRSRRTSEQIAIKSNEAAIRSKKGPIPHYFRFGKDRQVVRKIPLPNSHAAKQFQQKWKNDVNSS